MDLKTYLSKRISLIDRALDRLLPPGKDEPRDIHKAMRYSVFSGGKRIRPMIAIEAAAACGAPARAALGAACAIELVHTYSLVHDDLPSMDDDDYRRGKPSCHKAFGEANAILTGDALLTLAFGVLAEAMPPELSASAAKELSAAIGTCGMIGGQAADIEFKRRKMDAKTAGRINMLKTAKLFELSARMGAIAAKAPARKAKAMAIYGARLGAAFQVVDDILDNNGCSKLFGAAKARIDAGRMIEEAKAALKPFGRKADVLRRIADGVLCPVRRHGGCRPRNARHCEPRRGEAI